MNDPHLIAADAVAFRRAVHSGSAYKPLYIKIKLIWSCNLRCGMCNHWRDPVQPPLDTAFYRGLIDELAQLGTRKIHLTGGEPTLRPDLEDLIAHMSHRGIRATMTTNASLITAERARSLVEAGLNKVNISIDSPDPEVHDRVRGVMGAWQRTTQGFRHLRSQLKPGKMQINTVISAANYLSLGDLPRLALSLGADRIHLIPMDPHTPDLSCLSVAQIREYNRQVGPQILRQGLSQGLIQRRSQAFPFGIWPRQIQQSARGLYAHGYYDRHPCFAPWTHALIDHQGLVSVCCMSPHQPVLGDLKRQSFREIWTGSGFGALRHCEKEPQLEACRYCDMFLDQNRRLTRLI